MKFDLTLFVVCLVAFSTFIIVPTAYKNKMFNLIGRFDKANALMGKARNFTQLGHGTNSDSSQPSPLANEKLVDEFLDSRFNQETCLSSFQYSLYRKNSLEKPSSYLLKKLRNYENLYKQCGPHTKLYNKTANGLQNMSESSPIECKYVVWVPLEGLGNRILSMSSAFLYALVTNRVLLVENENDMLDLFCEPFPNTSRILPMDFPLKNQFKRFNHRHPQNLGKLFKNWIANTTSTESLPQVLYLFLTHNNDVDDMLFYCEQVQFILRKIPWFIIKSNQYFIPSLFLIPSFEQELTKMFPTKDTVFHHLSMFLFQPSNKAWELITRFYHSYVAKADQMIGIQIRVFSPKTVPFEHALNQILNCTQKENLLPKVNTQMSKPSALENKITKAVLITSLDPNYYEHIRNMYWTDGSITGEAIGVYQPSHEGHQQYGNYMHDMKAWVEMNLLSLSDVLVTSAWSTFGYVAQGLGGLKPWILYMPTKKWIPYPACRRAMSSEPCFHFAPHYDCKAKMEADLGAVVPYVQHCEDAIEGLKLVNPSD